MFNHLTLTRPLVILDLETTGVQVQRDRIVEISLLKLAPDGTKVQRTHRVNPGVPIPAEATRIHGISDADVAKEPRFKQLAAEIVRFLEGCDLCGFNIKRFDLRLLEIELNRVGCEFSVGGRQIIDAQEIFHRYEPRDLAAALRYYCGREHENSHRAEADVLVTVEVLDAMVGRYTDLPRSVEKLGMHFANPHAVDSAGKFIRVDGKVCFTFGKHEGRPIDEVARLDAAYLDWLLGADFHADTKAVVHDALSRANAAGSIKSARPTVRFQR